MVLFKRKPWPVTMGLGVALGMSVAECNFNLTYDYFHGKLKKEN